MSPITLEPIPTGYRVWKGKTQDFQGFLLANITTKQYKGLFRDGMGIAEPMPPESWSIHFTSPTFSLDELKAVAAVLPATA